MWTKVSGEIYKQTTVTEETVDVAQLKSDIQNLQAKILELQNKPNKEKLAEWEMMTLQPAQQSLQNLKDKIKEITGV